jgi:DNA (cytosine-5)-methyltransferase 1|tara:strand:- start:1320 stop:2297 length:978 start_codon:yes stop_codon:yes gene_type:complete
MRKGISFFSGCGGSSLGYTLAGVKMIYANEFIPKASETYSANFPNTYMDTRDIRKIQPQEILDIIKLKKGELDFLDGSPPCASFSSAGKREKGWGKVKSYSDKAQRTDDLFYEYIRMVKNIEPKIFIAENVSGLIMGKAKGYFNIFFREFSKLNYNVKASLLDASYLGVPQMRKRVFIIGVRKDLDKQPVFPKKQKRLIVKDVYDRNYPIEDEAKKLSPCYIPRLKLLKQGEQPQGSYFSLKRNHMLRPSYTITASYGAGACVMHPFEDRHMSIGELKDICSFPQDYKLLGSYRDKCERLGRSVPPNMMKNIVLTLKKEVFNEST